jgi:nitrate reductase NapE component
MVQQSANKKVMLFIFIYLCFSFSPLVAVAAVGRNVNEWWGRENEMVVYV